MKKFALVAIALTIAFSSIAQDYASPEQIPAKAFAQMPRMSDVAMSPDGTYIAYMMPKNGRNHIVIQPLEGGKAVSIPPMEKFDMRWMRWANNERLVFSVSFSARRWAIQSRETRLLSIDRAGTDLQQIVIPDRKPSSVKLSAYKPIAPQYQDNVIDWLVDDPEHILVSLDGNFDGKSEVRQIDVSNGQYRIARAGLSGVQRWMTDSDGKVSKEEFGKSKMAAGMDKRKAGNADKFFARADADSDGHHITTLLLTFFYRHMPQLISDGRLYIALPPLFRIDIGKETYWAADEEDRVKILKKHGEGRANPEITRFKGLGEMMPKVLWETTLNPATRRLLKVEIDDHLETDRVISDLMGRDASARFNFIMDRAETASEIDV